MIHSAHHHKALKGTTLVASSALMYGVIGYFGTAIINADFTVAAMLFWRFLLAFIGVSLVLLLTRLYPRNTQPVVPPEKQTARNSLNFLTNIMPAMMLAIVSYCGSSLFYFLASVRIGTGIAMVIFFAYPIFVVFFSCLKKPYLLTKQTLSALTIVLIGLYLLKDNQQQSFSWVGLFFGLLAAFSYGVYVFFGQYNVKIMDSRIQTWWLCLGNAILFLVLAVFEGGQLWPKEFSIWLNIIGIGIIGTALPIQFMLDGLKYVNAIKASILSVLEPITTVLLGFVLLNESLSLMQSLGIVVVLLGALMIQFEKHESPLLVEE